MHQFKYLVIGCSAAGLAAVTRLRLLDSTSSIACLSYEFEPPYNKCFLVDELGGAQISSKVFTKPFSFFKENNMHLFLNTHVIALDRGKKMVACADGATFLYEKLLLATGATARALPTEGPGLFSFYTLADLQAFKAWITQPFVKSVVIIGSGLTGLEVADALKKFPVLVTVIERQEHVLSRHIDQQGAQILQNLMHKQNITVVTSTNFSEILFKDGRVSAVVVEGAVLPAQAVLGALGSCVQSDLARDAGIVCESGSVVVNDVLQTNEPSIFAAGDCALVTDSFGNRVRTALWSDALQQGNCAAYAMAGQEKRYQPADPITTSSFFGVTFFSAGLLHTDDPAFTVLVEASALHYQKIIVDQKRVVRGFISLGTEHKQLILLKRSFLNKTEIFHDRISFL